MLVPASLAQATPSGPFYRGILLAPHKGLGGFFGGGCMKNVLYLEKKNLQSTKNKLQNPLHSLGCRNTFQSS